MKDIEIGLLRQAMAFHRRSEINYRTVFFSGSNRMYVTAADPNEIIAEGDEGHHLVKEAIAFVNSKPITQEEKRNGRKSSEDNFSNEAMRKILLYEQDRRWSVAQEKFRADQEKKDREYHAWLHRHDEPSTI